MQPFVFIASYPRSGSTLLAEALIDWPRSFIHIEPGIAATKLWTYGIERLGWRWRWRLRTALRGIQRLEGPDAYAREIPPLIPVDQFGIKEVYFRRYKFRHVLRERPDTRVVVTTRDPRDLWLSVSELRERRGESPHALDHFAARVANQDRQIAALLDESLSLVVRYEDLCTDPKVFDNVLAHIDSPLTEPGSVGAYTRRARPWEAERHAQPFGKGSVMRWKREPAPDDAHRFADALIDYRRRYGYE